jgi:hypothetical protein
VIRARCARTDGGVPTFGPVIACSDAYDGERRLWPVSTLGNASRGLATPRPVSAASASSWRFGAEELRSSPGRPLKAREGGGGQRGGGGGGGGRARRSLRWGNALVAASGGISSSFISLRFPKFCKQNQSTPKPSTELAPFANNRSAKSKREGEDSSEARAQSRGELTIGDAYGGARRLWAVLERGLVVRTAKVAGGRSGERVREC